MDISEYQLSDKFVEAFQHFNRRLFAGRLPPAVITLQRHAKARGYFSPGAFRHRKTQDEAHEIAMNPDTFEDQTDREVLSTLVHEMAHLWQQVEGTPSRNGYHNREWAHRMLELGLQPVSFDGPGKITGQKVTHEIMEAGKFDHACAELLSTGFYLAWQGHYLLKAKKNQAANKVKYTCPVCGLNAWGKPEIWLLCGECEEELEPEE